MRPVAWKSAPAIQTAGASCRVPMWRKAPSRDTAPRNGVSWPAGTPKRSSTPEARRTRASTSPPVSVTGAAAGGAGDSSGTCVIAPPRRAGHAAAHGDANRGARIRTGDLTDPNGARYQAAPRPEARPSVYSRGARHGLVVAHRQPGQERLERGIHGRPLALGPAHEALVLDGLGLGDHVVAQL